VRSSTLRARFITPQRSRQRARSARAGLDCEARPELAGLRARALGCDRLAPEGTAHPEHPAACTPPGRWSRNGDQRLRARRCDSAPSSQRATHTGECRGAIATHPEGVPGRSALSRRWFATTWGPHTRQSSLRGKPAEPGRQPRKAPTFDFAPIDGGTVLPSTLTRAGGRQSRLVLLDSPASNPLLFLPTPLGRRMAPPLALTMPPNCPRSQPPEMVVHVELQKPRIGSGSTKRIVELRSSRKHFCRRTRRERRQ
jgi:hypothetical protein